VTELMPSGGSLSFSTYLGGADLDQGQDLAVNDAGAIYVTGHTFSTNFPVKDALQPQMLGNSDAFVSKIADASLIYSTFLGGSLGDNGTAIATMGIDLAYVTGMTESSDFLQSKTSGTLTDAFVVKIKDSGNTVPPSEPNLSGSFKKASQHHLAPGEELTYTIRLLNSGGAGTTADVVDELPEPMEYVAGSVTGGGTYDASTHSLSWDDVSVQAGEEILLTFKVTASVEKVETVVNTAVITPDGQQSLNRSATVVLLANPLPDDRIPPEVLSVEIDEKDVLTDTSVTLHIEASDNEAVTKMFIKEVWLATKPIPHWETVQSSGWLPYEAEYEWQLIEESGTHFVVVWVGDDAGNVSIATPKSIDYASLLLPNETIRSLGLVPYMVHFDSGESVTATLKPSVGDPDLFVWYPGNSGLPDEKSTNTGTSIDQVEFVAPKTGTYMFLVFGFSTSTYDFAIEPGGGIMGDLPHEPLSQTDKFVFPSEPILSQSGMDPLANVEPPTSPGVSNNKFTIAMPLIIAGK